MHVSVFHYWSNKQLENSHGVQSLTLNFTDGKLSLFRPRTEYFNFRADILTELKRVIRFGGFCAEL